MPEADLTEELAPELDGERVYGGDESDELFSAHFSDAPIAISVESLYEAAGVEIPKTLGLYERFKLWVVPHHFGLVRKRGMAEPVSVSIRVQYLVETGTCSVVSLFPSAEFVRLGGVTLRAKVGLEIDTPAMFQALAQLSPAGILTPERSVEAAGSSKIKLPGLDLDATAAAGAEINLSAEVTTPIISAVGVGGSSCQWRFNRHQESLEGKDIKTWAVVALSKRERSLSYRVQHAYTRRVAWVPTLRQGSEHTVNCSLA